MGQKKSIDRILNVKGLLCPAPTVMTMKALEEMEKGKTLQVITNDITTKQTIPEICAQQEYEMLELEEKEGLLYFIIRK